MDLAVRADANYYAAWRMLGRVIEAGAVPGSGGLLLTDTGLRVAWPYIAFVTRPAPCREWRRWGRPIYVRMGFELVSPYRTYQLPGV